MKRVKKFYKRDILGFIYIIGMCLCCFLLGTSFPNKNAIRLDFLNRDISCSNKLPSNEEIVNLYLSDNKHRSIGLFYHGFKYECIDQSFTQ